MKDSGYQEAPLVEAADTTVRFRLSAPPPSSAWASLPLSLLCCYFALESFWKNPQFLLVLTERDHPHDDDGNEEQEEEEEDESDGSDSDEMTPEEKRAKKQKQKSKRCTVLVELLQKNRRQKDKVHFLYVAFHVYKVTPRPQNMTLLFTIKLSPTLVSPLFLQVPSDVSVCSSAALYILILRRISFFCVCVCVCSAPGCVFASQLLHEKQPHGSIWEI